MDVYREVVDAIAKGLSDTFYVSFDLSGGYTTITTVYVQRHEKAGDTRLPVLTVISSWPNVKVTSIADVKKQWVVRSVSSSLIGEICERAQDDFLKGSQLKNRIS